jgi:dihydroflavonol-4-reductase
LKTLVTGATGFVGSELVRQLSGRGEDVRILRRRESSLTLLGDVADRVEHAIGDVADADSVIAALHGIGRVYHTAGLVRFEGKSGEGLLRQVNVQGVANVVNAALRSGVERLVLTSSMAAFGRPDVPSSVIDETAEWQNSSVNSVYARSKYEGELEVYRGIAEGLSAVIVNPAVIFGVGRAGDNTMQIVEKVRNRKLPAIPPGGTNVVDVIDVAAGHVRAMEAGEVGERYFLGGENLSWSEIIGTLADAFGVEPPRFKVGPQVALGIARVSKVVSAVTGARPLITMETARTASRFYRYSNRKATEDLGCTFRPFRETAERIARELSAVSYQLSARRDAGK